MNTADKNRNINYDYRKNWQLNRVTFSKIHLKFQDQICARKYSRFTTNPMSGECSYESERYFYNKVKCIFIFCPLLVG